MAIHGRLREGPLLAYACPRSSLNTCKRKANISLGFRGEVPNLELRHRARRSSSLNREAILPRRPRASASKHQPGLHLHAPATGHLAEVQLVQSLAQLRVFLVHRRGRLVLAG